MIYHFYKADCYRASRVLMQSRWDGDSVFIHKSQNDNYKHNKKFSLVSVLNVMQKSSRDDVIVFHAQSSLPYLLVSYVFKKITGRKISLIYDIHDLHEWESSYRIIARSGLRFFILGFLEKIVFSIEEIRKITVSNGLAILMANKYKKSLPVVVRNTSGEVEEVEYLDREKNAVLFFGIKERAPIGLLGKLNSAGVEVHLYGRGMTGDWLKGIFGNNHKGVKVFGEYDPKKMGFLNNYKVLILYPNDNKLNYKYSMPNKLFQAIDHGLCVVVSDYFEEILQTFQKATGCIYDANDKNIQNVVLEALENWTDESCNQARIIKSEIYSDSKEKYIECLNASRV